MKLILRSATLTFTVIYLLLFMTSCDAIGSIFQAGAYTGIIGVILVIGLVIWLLSKFVGGSGRNS